MNTGARLLITAFAALLLLGSCSTSRRHTNRGNESRTSTTAVDSRTAGSIIAEAERWIGTPYRYGKQQRKKGTDCSGMVMEVYLKTTGIKLPRNSAAQQEFCNRISRDELSPGDLVFFSPSSRGGRVGHVGIYRGDGRFIHASASKGVIESKLNEKYYTTHFHSAGRVPGIRTNKRRNNTATPEPETPEIPEIPVVRPSVPQNVTEITLDSLINMSIGNGHQEDAPDIITTESARDSSFIIADSIFNSVRSAF